MKFMILAAGRSSRYGGNKLLEVFNGKTLPQYAAEFAAHLNAEEIFLTVSRDGVQTDGTRVFHPVVDNVSRITNSKGIPLRVTFQDPESYGPGGAIMAWDGVVEGPFVVLFGDNLYLPTLDVKERISGLESWLQSPEGVAFTYKEIPEPHPRNLQLAAVLDREILLEKPHSIVSGEYFCGFVAFPSNFFTNVGKIRKSDRGEIELTDMVNSYGARLGIPLSEYCRNWADLTYEGDYGKILSLVE
ncbi:glucose-1-phosphate thymidylyltransferase [Synechococcus phage S-CBWM1]|uniref:Glucose-1-phosphate thymidylyltransferase n=1 Tax=Synechococcus phage S-CBWM1 TaxID=2053653 RepID=A0A3G1L3D0_9CAUD|nr:glucose-1-phosphate thymidylyltransferase [Synechococcus phage S-CBWM1]ATW62695.1 glucose-1-phosphate thymidylyltransferase [Synechococcus phage S-CBWM1]